MNQVKDPTWKRRLAKGGQNDKKLIILGFHLNHNFIFDLCEIRISRDYTPDAVQSIERLGSCILCFIYNFNRNGWSRSSENYKKELHLQAIHNSIIP